MGGKGVECPKMKWAEGKPLGAEPQGEVSFRAQQNGPASRLGADSLPFLPALMPQPLENDITPLLHPHTDVALPCLHPQG